MEFYGKLGVKEAECAVLAQAQPFRDYLYVSPHGTRLFQLRLSELERLLCAASTRTSLALFDRLTVEVNLAELPARWLQQWGYGDEAALLDTLQGDRYAEAAGG